MPSYLEDILNRLTEAVESVGQEFKHSRFISPEREKQMSANLQDVRMRVGKLQSSLDVARKGELIVTGELEARQYRIEELGREIKKLRFELVGMKEEVERLKAILHAPF